MPLPRRLFLAAGLAAFAGPALAREDGARIEHRGHVVDLSALAAGRRPEIAAYVRQQIDQVQNLPIRDDIKAWFATVTITIDPTLDMAGRFNGGRLTLDDRVSPPENPVLLHELLHAYMDQRLPRTGEVRGFYEQARASGDWPAQSYMLSNVAEFFAMTGSVALWGQAARPPSTRERLRERMPEYYDWLATHFGLRA